MQEIITKIIIGAAAAWAIYRIFKWFGRRRKSQCGCGCGACGCGGCDGCARRSACEKEKQSDEIADNQRQSSPKRDDRHDDASRFGNSRAGRRAGPYRRLPDRSLHGLHAMPRNGRVLAAARRRTRIWPSMDSSRWLSLEQRAQITAVMASTSLYTSLNGGAFFQSTVSYNVYTMF